MLGYTLVDAFMRGTCSAALSSLKRAIATVDGTITDCRTYTTSAVRMNVELEARAVAKLADALEAVDVHVFDECAAELAKARSVIPATKPLTALVHVTLIA